jgi:hypothetical protein
MVGLCVFTFSDAKRITLSLKRSAEISKRRKGTPFQSAMSMLNFYITGQEKIYRKNEKLFSKKQKGNYENYLIRIKPHPYPSPKERES